MSLHFRKQVSLLSTIFIYLLKPTPGLPELVSTANFPHMN